MKFFKVAFGLLAAAAILPYQVNVVKEDENADAKTITVKSLLYTVEIEPKKDENGAPTEERDVSIIFPSDLVKKVVGSVKSKIADVKAARAAAEEAVSYEDAEDDILVEDIPEA